MDGGADGVDHDAPAPYELAVLAEGPSAAHVVVKAHHIIADAWALNLFLEQTGARYARLVGIADHLARRG